MIVVLSYSQRFEVPSKSGNAKWVHTCKDAHIHPMSLGGNDGNCYSVGYVTEKAMVELKRHHLKIINNGIMASDATQMHRMLKKWDFSNFKPKGNPIHYITGIREEGNAAGENALSTTNRAKRKKRKEQGTALCIQEPEYTGI